MHIFDEFESFFFSSNMITVKNLLSVSLKVTGLMEWEKAFVYHFFFFVLFKSLSKNRENSSQIVGYIKSKKMLNVIHLYDKYMLINITQAEIIHT